LPNSYVIQNVAAHGNEAIRELVRPLNFDTFWAFFVKSDFYVDA